MFNFNYVKKRMKQGEALVKRARGGGGTVLAVASGGDGIMLRAVFLAVGGMFLTLLMGMNLRVIYVVADVLYSFGFKDSFGLACSVVMIVSVLPCIIWVARNVGIVVVIPALCLILCFVLIDVVHLGEENTKITAIVIAVVIMLCLGLSVVLASKSNMLGLTNTRLIGRTRFGGKTLDCPLNEVVSVSVVERGRGLRGLFRRIALGETICVKTASDTFLFNYIEDAENFKNAITAEIDKYKEAAGKQQEAA